MTYYIGIDLGGTNLKAGVVTAEGRLLSKHSIKTNADRSWEDIVRDMGDMALRVLDQSGLKKDDVEAIGIGSPGTPDNEKGLLIYSNNLPFYMTPMRAYINRMIDLPIYLDNDANCAAMAESVVGAAMGSKISVTVTLGTGIGCGVIIDDRIYSGFNQAGSEFGHTVLVAGGVPCTCGRKGCIESYASATALIRMTKEMAAKHPTSQLAKLIEQRGGKINAKIAFDAMRMGDKVGEDLVDTYIDYLAESLVNIINAFMPEILVIGGGVCNEGEPLMRPLLTKIEEKKPYFGPGVSRTVLRLAKMGNDAGLIGAAMMGKTCYEDHKHG